MHRLKQIAFIFKINKQEQAILCFLLETSAYHQSANDHRGLHRSFTEDVHLFTCSV